MNTETPERPPLTQFSDAARDAAQKAGNAVRDAAHDATDTAKDAAQRAGSAVKDAAHNASDAAHRATDAAKDMCHTMSVKAEDTLVRSKEYARQNPVPVLLGALAVGAVLGCLIVLTRRPEPTFRQRYVDDPLLTARDAIYAALAPVAQRLHEDYDSARDGAGKAMDAVHRYSPTRTLNSWSDQIGRVGSNLKFW